MHALSSNYANQHKQDLHRSLFDGTQHKLLTKISIWKSNRASHRYKSQDGQQTQSWEPSHHSAIIIPSVISLASRLLDSSLAAEGENIHIQNPATSSTCSSIVQTPVTPFMACNLNCSGPRKSHNTLWISIQI